MKKIFNCLLFSVLLSFGLLGQKDIHTRPALQLETKDDQITSVKDLWKTLEGSYQFIVSKEGYQIVHSKSLYDLITSSRKKDEDVRLSVDEFTVLFLPAENSLNSSDFVDLLPVVIYSK